LPWSGKLLRLELLDFVIVLIFDSALEVAHFFEEVCRRAILGCRGGLEVWSWTVTGVRGAGMLGGNSGPVLVAIEGGKQNDIVGLCLGARQAWREVLG